MVDLLKTSGVSFPDENVSAAEKRTAAWRMKYAQAAYSSYLSYGGGRLFEVDNDFNGIIGRNSADRYNYIKAYAYGKQPVSKYKKDLAPGNDPTNINLQVNWKVLPIIPRFRRTAIGLLEKGQDYDVTINPIDALARNEIQDTLNNIRGKILLKKSLEKNGLSAIVGTSPVLEQEPNEPADLDGLEIQAIGLRHRTAMEAEQIVDLIFTQNKYEDLRKGYIEDLFDYGVSVLKDSTEDVFIKLTRCDMRQVVLNYCRTNDFSDLKYIGEIKSIPVSTIEACTNGSVSKDDLRKLYERAKVFSWGVPTPFSSASNFDEWFGNGSVQVLDLEIKSTDTIILEERTDKRGNKKYGRTDRSTHGTKTKVVENIYCVKWIVGTNITYGYSKPTRVKRNPSNLSTAKFSYTIVCNELFDMQTFSRTEALIPYADEIQFAWYKLQHALNSAVPKGVAIDFDALEEVTLSAGGKRLSPKDLLNLYFQRGILLYRGRRVTNPNQQNIKWVDELMGGVGNEIVAFNNVIQTNIELIRYTLGMNDVTDGSTPNPKLLNGVASLAASGTNNGLSDIYDADRKMTQDVSESCIIRAQYMIAEGNGEAFISALGFGTATLLSSVPDIDRYTYGVAIESRPNVEERQALETALQTALSSVQITVDDYLRVKSIRNMKQAELYLAYKVQKNIELEQQRSSQMQLQNAQIQQQSAQVAEQSKQQSMQVEYQLKSELSAQEHKQKLEQLNLEGQLRLEAERISASGRVESSYVQAKERQESNVRNNVTKLIKEDKDEKTPVINIKEDLRSNVEPATSAEEPILPISEKEFSFSQDEDNENGSNIEQPNTN